MSFSPMQSFKSVVPLSKQSQMRLHCCLWLCKELDHERRYELVPLVVCLVLYPLEAQQQPFVVPQVRL